MAVRKRRKDLLLRNLPVGVAALITLSLVVGGVVDVQRESRPFERTSNQTFAGEARTLVASSNRVGDTLILRVLGVNGRISRSALQLLPSLVDESATLTDRALLIGTNVSTKQLVKNFHQVMHERANGVKAVALALWGYEGISPLSDLSNGQVIPVGKVPTLLSLPTALTKLQSAIGQLEAADSLYATIRQRIMKIPGTLTMPPSKWIATHSQWTTAFVTSIFSQLPIVTTDLVIPQNGVSITPPSIPETPPTPTTSVISPTKSLKVTVLVANNGTSGVEAETLSVILKPITTGNPVSKTASVRLTDPGTSEVLGPFEFTVQPGIIYTLGISVTFPRGEESGAATTRHFRLRDATSLHPPK